MKQEIIKTLETKSWNGIASNGTPFTQWKATDEFFKLWAEKKIQIKEQKFSLYKHDERGWVVTLFDSSEGTYESYTDYLIAKKKDVLTDMTDDEEILDEIRSATTVSQLSDLEMYYSI